MAGSEWFLLGAPWDCSGSGRGEQLAPEALRRAGLGAWAGADVGDAATPIGSTARDAETLVRALGDTERAARGLADALSGATRAHPGLRPLVVGGDCSLLLGVFAAQPPGVGLWFVDGHPDYSDGPGSGTGETADMDLAILHGDGAASLVGLAGRRPMVAVPDTVLIGHRTRGLDADSAAELARLPDALRRIDADAVRADPSGAGRRAAAWLDGVQAGVWLHIDLDVLAPEALPAVTYPQPGGPDWDQLAALLNPLGRSPRLIGASVADFRPDLDPGGAYARRIVGLLDSTLG